MSFYKVYLDNISNSKQEEKLMEKYKFESGALKHLKGKLRYDLITPEAEKALASVLSYGAEKYDDRNWEKGLPFDTMYGAMRRHIEKFRQGEVLDSESGLPHLHHALCNLMMIVTLEDRKNAD